MQNLRRLFNNRLRKSNILNRLNMNRRSKFEKLRYSNNRLGMTILSLAFYNVFFYALKSLVLITTHNFNNYKII